MATPAPIRSGTGDCRGAFLCIFSYDGAMDAPLLAGTVLGCHLAVIVFNLFGLIAIPLGAWRGWKFVRVVWWRALHLGVLALVALQALFGRACFLTLWQDTLAGDATPAPLIERWVNALIFWPLPIGVFAALYAAVFGYTLALWFLVPPGRSRSLVAPGPTR